MCLNKVLMQVMFRMLLLRPAKLASLSFLLHRTKFSLFIFLAMAHDSLFSLIFIHIFNFFISSTYSSRYILNIYFCLRFLVFLSLGRIRWDRGNLLIGNGRKLRSKLVIGDRKSPCRDKKRK